MTVKQRVENRFSFRSESFRINDPEQGVGVANVNEFQFVPKESPVWAYEVVEETV
jgi:hypothetical protein